MFRRILSSPVAHLFTVAGALATLGLAGCKSSPEKKKQKEQVAAQQKLLKENPRLADINRDPAFQSFVGRLRIAVERRDRAVLSTLMAQGFGWRWDAPPAGETPFSYWDQNNLWPELLALVQQPFVPTPDGYLVSPPEFATAQEGTYNGYRCGIRNIGGSWKLQYFVGGNDVVPL